MANEFILKFKEAMLKITNDKQFIKSEYLFARTDEVRQEIIDGINEGILKNEEDISLWTLKMSPVYHLL